MPRWWVRLCEWTLRKVFGQLWKDSEELQRIRDVLGEDFDAGAAYLLKESHITAVRHARQAGDAVYGMTVLRSRLRGYDVEDYEDSGRFVDAVAERLCGLHSANQTFQRQNASLQKTNNYLRAQLAELTKRKA